MKHTPGPWHYFQTEVSEYEGGGSRWTVCIPTEYDGDEVAEYLIIAEVAASGDDAVNQADARLIAAAPDMLAALENLENDDGAIPAHAWGLVQAAVKKARGES